MGRGRTSHRSSGRRADLRWTGGLASFAALSAGSSAVAVLTQGNTSQTLMRVRGNVLANVEGAEAQGDSAEIGISLLLGQAGLGAAEIESTPLGDPDAPFIWYTRFVLAAVGTGADDALGGRVYREVVDNKAMRVIRPDQELYVVVESLTISGALAADVHVGLRMLLAD